MAKSEKMKNFEKTWLTHRRPDLKKIWPYPHKCLRSILTTGSLSFTNPVIIKAFFIFFKKKKKKSDLMLNKLIYF